MAMASKTRRGPKQVTDSHKKAMALGRSESRAVGSYLAALEANRPKRGRRRTSESITARLEAIDEALAEADMLTRVNLIQERMNLAHELDLIDDVVDLSDLEAEFVSVAHNYSQRRGISYAAWREAGIDAALLRKAGIGR